MRFIGVEVEQGTSAPPPKKNPGSAPVVSLWMKSCDVTIRMNSLQQYFYTVLYGLYVK